MYDVWDKNIKVVIVVGSKYPSDITVKNFKRNELFKMLKIRNFDLRWQ
jgi:hypothetical protein